MSTESDYDLLSILGINDVVPTIGADWYDLTGLLKFGCSR